MEFHGLLNPHDETSSALGVAQPEAFPETGGSTHWQYPFGGVFVIDLVMITSIMATVFSGHLCEPHVSLDNMSSSSTVMSS